MGEEQLSVEEAHAMEMFLIKNRIASTNAASDEAITYEDALQRAVEARKARKGQGKVDRHTDLLIIYLQPHYYFILVFL